MLRRVFALAIALSSMPAWAEPEWVRAEIRRLDVEKSRIVLKHERIKSIDMDAMTMQFDVNKSVSLAGFRVGDAVRFQVVIHSGALEVTALEKR
jgi:Cu/Ag efflux protein CusF